MIYNLAYAKSLVENALNHKPSFFSPEKYNSTEKDYLQKLKQRIDAIEHTILHFENDDANLANKTNKSQLELDHDIHEDYRKLIGFSAITLHNLSKQIKDEMQRTANRHYRELLANLTLILHHIKIHLSEKITLNKTRPYESAVATESYDQFLSKNKDIFLLTTALGGKYIAASQAITNPLYVNSAGYCAGLVLNWSEKIANGENAGNPFFVSDEHIETLQQTQDSIYRKKLTKSFSAVDDVRNLFNVGHLLNNILADIKEDGVYSLSVPSENEKTSFGFLGRHAFGIRKIPGTSCYEIMEPNHGIFLLPNKQSCLIWLTNLFTYTQYRTCEPIKLRELAKQPNQSPSILSLDNDQKRLAVVAKLLSEPREFSYREACLLVEPYSRLTNFLRDEGFINNQFIIDTFRIALHQILQISDKNINRASDFAGDDALRKKTLSYIHSENSLTFPNSPWNRVLGQLEHSVQSAPSGVTLQTIVEDWFFTPEVLNCSSATTQSFINRLLDEYEINPYRLSLIRLNIVNSCLSIEENYQTPYVKNVVKLIKQSLEEGLSFSQVLDKVKKYTELNNSPHTFSLSKKNERDLKLSQAFLRLDNDNPKSLVELNTQASIYQQEHYQQEQLLNSRKLNPPTVSNRP